ncbi:MarR family winged helix-turn-helix transcriptional regulator [Nocardiopsis sp. NRRL B-16309]|uniref:MarR family winged helix-turn-helix transcriptional regulator n=1 Tax=Nocardiopsis sp. NRRL B-16309 TaxID=1519494 RepID=UPI0006B01DDC|nr:MarR family transcriptional regulator [Nocardiopsis sp. NRRL B-16309]KOX15745.1 MarR family transcriptional regulator [Nocardiopsis sp. NRRL B-16309]
MQNPPQTPPEHPAARWERTPSWLLNQTAHHAQRLVADGFSSLNARGYHYRLLATLHDSGPASQAELGRRSGIHVSDMVATVNELTEAALVERTPDPADRRRNIISLTTEGQHRLRRLEEQLAATQDTLLAPLSPDERAHLTDLLATVLDHHEQHTRTRPPH